MTHRAGRSKPGVILASPVGQPLSLRQASSNRGPAARWMAPSTPPPPSSVELAVLTIASTDSRVMSPRTISMRSSSELTAACPVDDQAPDGIKVRRKFRPLFSDLALVYCKPKLRH